MPSILFKTLIPFIYMWVGAFTCPSIDTEVRGQLARADSLFPSHVSRESDSSLWAWWKYPIPPGAISPVQSVFLSCTATSDSPQSSSMTSEVDVSGVFRVGRQAIIVHNAILMDI